MLALKPAEIEYEMLTIPKGTNGIIQPLDVLCFGQYMDFFRKICNWILVNGEPVQVRPRDVVLRLHSLTYRQFCSPRFENLITEAWHKCGYTDHHVKYITPAEFCFKDLAGTCYHEDCKNSVLLVCGWCKGRLCFEHFFVAYHNCFLYLP